MKKILTTLVMLALLTALPGTALAADTAFTNNAHVNVDDSALDTGSSCPPNIKTCIENTREFACNVMDRAVLLALWLLFELGVLDPSYVDYRGCSSS